MREVVFRGKRIDNGEWIYGDLRQYSKKHIGIYSFELQQIVRGIDPSTVGQYTGLKDKNGKRIFEGDIMEYNDGYDYFKGKVVFELGAFGIGNSEVCQAFIGNCDNFASLWDIYWEQEPIDAPELYYCTILGNIHDNPELLEVR